MRTETEIKDLVREKYGEIARSPAGSSCCSSRSCCGVGGDVDGEYIGEDYSRVEGYRAVADLGLGCGLPTEHAGLRKGITVLDLGSGAGNDAFIARRIVGESGKIVGVDMTPDMVSRARKNAANLGYSNVEFLLGDIESLPVESTSIDAVISNCVLNLVPDKARAFVEIHRVLRPRGHFCISDVVVTGPLPDEVREAAELYVGCVAGAMQRDGYIELVRESGFERVEVVKERVIELPDELDGNFDRATVNAYRKSPSKAVSITLKGYRPAAKTQKPTRIHAMRTSIFKTQLENNSDSGLCFVMPERTDCADGEKCAAETGVCCASGGCS
jgi:arsenite methyltransferase